MSWTRTTVIRAGAGAILTATAISAGVYIAGAEDHTPSAAEAETIKAAVNDALNTSYANAVTPGDTEKLAALTTEQLDHKYADVEKHLRAVYTGPPLDRELEGMATVREAESEGDGFRVVGGGARALDWTSVTIDGDTAHAAGRDEAWLDTAQPDEEGQYTAAHAYTQHSFVIDLKKNPDGSWITTEMTLKKDVPGYLP
ncbi:hypothetical protein R3Q06_32790 [Rhodococcus erythropolis]|uniref:hypothetical protein n=1 Tax=Rhodococcus erythropolis TaxID=1833 RepID=UPI00294978C7|nr:hypothetical protein [Rhodococcus erythropolis]MDV6278244.1 hypothetical protein [Rhodococcus erythropolis]